MVLIEQKARKFVAQVPVLSEAATELLGCLHQIAKICRTRKKKKICQMCGVIQRVNDVNVSLSYKSFADLNVKA